MEMRNEWCISHHSGKGREHSCAHPAHPRPSPPVSARPDNLPLYLHLAAPLRDVLIFPICRGRPKPPPG
ncbi:hypothetical protein E2C01_042014 [Portunus trituberculatus]|uniref:Uncharacterized protein n=1 Tax=Portunus trituberculatus TaxID=210409 RepID=A0A5B7FRW2_PORTR|nr:hypothetical protein [Portunus trituberculatus]